MKIPLYFMIPALMGFTSLFFLKEGWNYSIQEWLIANGIISLGIGLTYIINGIYIMIKDGRKAKEN